MKNASNRVAVLAGGHSSEHAISVLSGEALVRGARAAGFEVIPVLIASTGEWMVYSALEASSSALNSASEPFHFSHPPSLQLRGNALQCTQWLLQEGIECVLLGLHGSGGEDGSIQGFLETVGLPFTGSGTQASAFAIDKIAFKHLLRGAGLTTPQSLDFSGTDLAEAEAVGRALQEWWNQAPHGAVIKAKGLGSSVGVELAPQLPQAQEIVARLGKEFGEVLVESRIMGRELTVPVVSDPRRATGCMALPVIEIIPQHASWFDYSSKYATGGAMEIVPAEIPTELAAKVQELAIAVHSLIGARGVTRTDFMVDAQNRPWIIETNTLPGLTEASLVPKAAHAVGWTMADLVLRLVNDAKSTLGHLSEVSGFGQPSRSQGTSALEASTDDPGKGASESSKER